ncbi:hypothetical protein ACP4OV_027692 [Aristida adscensionis]
MRTSGFSSTGDGHRMSSRTGRCSYVLENRKVLILTYSWQAWLEDIITPTRQQELSDAGCNFLDHDMVFIPFLFDNHWILVVTNFVKAELQVLDSNPRYGYKRVLSKLLRDRKGRVPLDITKWKIHIIKRLPRQTDGTSCGIFMLKYMQLWNGTRLLEKFSKDDIASIREEIAVELVFSELNTVHKVQAEIMEWKVVN